VKRRIAIAGNGAWGQALAHVARTAGHDVGMWSRQKSDVVSFVSLDAIIVAVPAQAVRQVLTLIKPPKGISLIISAKGIEVMKQQPDGTWKIVIDHAFGAEANL